MSKIILSINLIGLVALGVALFCTYWVISDSYGLLQSMPYWILLLSWNSILFLTMYGNSFGLVKNHKYRVFMCICILLSLVLWAGTIALIVFGVLRLPKYYDKIGPHILIGIAISVFMVALSIYFFFHRNLKRTKEE